MIDFSRVISGEKRNECGNEAERRTIMQHCKNRNWKSRLMASLLKKSTCTNSEIVKLYDQGTHTDYGCVVRCGTIGTLEMLDLLSRED